MFFVPLFNTIQLIIAFLFKFTVIQDIKFISISNREMLLNMKSLKVHSKLLPVFQDSN